MATSRTVFVAGAGIGGLTAALALAAKRFRVVILEKAERLEEAGAGLQLSPNASRVLIGLGLQSRLERSAVTPDAVSLVRARSGKEITRLPLGDAAMFRFGAPYWVMHRADLQAALYEAANQHPDIELRLSWQFEDAGLHAKGVTVVQRRGMARQEDVALALIGADGIWSSVRQHLFPEAPKAQFSGLIAWRGTMNATEVPRDFSAGRVQLWMGPDAHLVVYPISGGRRINVVAVLPGTWNRPGWSAPGESSEIKNVFASRRWSSGARMLLGAVDEWKKWALFTVPDDIEWSQGGATLLGDAAHAMLPFAAQGAAMAIEDAAVLAEYLGDVPNPNGANVTVALKRYAGIRHARIARLQAMARQQGRIYHLGGPAALMRDLIIRTLGPRRLMERQDWIYDWRL